MPFFMLAGLEDRKHLSIPVWLLLLLPMASIATAFLFWPPIISWLSSCGYPAWLLMLLPLLTSALLVLTNRNPADIIALASLAIGWGIFAFLPLAIFCILNLYSVLAGEKGEYPALWRLFLAVSFSAFLLA